MKQSIIWQLLGRAVAGALDALSGMASIRRAELQNSLLAGLAGRTTLNRWTSGLGHRGQPSAKGLMDWRNERPAGGKAPSRRDKHRDEARELGANTAAYSRALAHHGPDMMITTRKAARRAGWMQKV
jgi:hypothetical protein